MGRIQQGNVIKVIDDYGICQIQADTDFHNQSLQEIKIGNRYNVSVLLIKRESNQETQVIQPTGAGKLYESDQLILLGKTEVLNKLVNYGWKY